MNVKDVNTLFIAIAIILSGCTAVPTVDLHRIAKPEDLLNEDGDAYFLQRSIIKIDKASVAKEGGEPEKHAFTVTSTPAEFMSFKVGVVPVESWGVRTNLNITKIQNTDLLSEVGTEVVDNRREIIEQVGQILVVVASLVPLDATDLKDEDLPLELNVDNFLAGTDRDAKSGISTGKRVMIDFDQLPPDARPISEFTGTLRLNGLIYSACRGATVKFKYYGTPVQQRVKVSDPRFFQRVNFPVKGKISLHSGCGVSVQSEKETGVATTLDLAATIAAQGKAIKEAIEASKKNDENK
jgi:hypothetical protein